MPLTHRLIDGYAVQAACWFQNSLAGLRKRLSIFESLFCRRPFLNEYLATMNKLKLALAAVVISTGLASCSSTTTSLGHQGKFNPCFFSDKKGTIRPYQSNEDRVTERYHFRNPIEKK